MKQALFAISSLGLGHATRSLPVINRLKDEYEITVICWADALEFLKKELGDSVCYLEYEDYPKLERGRGWRFYLFLLTDLVQTNLIIRREQRLMESLENQFDLVISDGRYGFYSKVAPSFLISHQISFIPPKGLGVFRFLTVLGNFSYFRKFNMVWIPDYASVKKNLAGHLSHPRFLKFIRHRFIGVLSAYKKIDVKEDIDWLFVISGYLEFQKKSFISELLEAAKGLEGRKVFILGTPQENEIKEMPEEQITIYPYASGELRNELFNRAKTVISRTGYTTIMDLVELDKKAILFPTYNSTEQEYLALYHKGLGQFVIGEERGSIDLTTLATALEHICPTPDLSKTAEALSTIETIIKENLSPYFFTIVIPACNEEKYLDTTLQKISDLKYSQAFYEVIVVENGSDDQTLAIAKSWEEKLPNLKVLQSPKGVSRAKNEGVRQSSSVSEYIVFLDSDTHLEPSFFDTLNTWIHRHKDENRVVGTTAISPADSTTFYDRGWFSILNFGHRLSKTSCSLQIARTDIARNVCFDESLNYSEDLKFIKDMQVFGGFFYIDTDTVSTSTRRFKQQGYFRTLFKWNIQAFTPYRLKKNRDYKVVR